MNKLFSKIAALSVGLAMAIGVGVAVGSKGVKEARADYEETTTLAVGDTIVFANDAAKKEFKAIVTMGSIKAAEVVDYSGSVPNAVHPFTIEAGSAADSFAFKASDNSYLSWTSGNSLTTSTSIDGSSSWKLVSVSGKGLMLQNVGTTTRHLSYNASSPRFATYNNQGQSGINFYKYVSGETTKYTVSYNANGGSGTMEDTVASAPVIATPTFTAPEGKKFGSWNTSSDGKGDSYAPGTSVSQDLELFAIWVNIPEYTCAEAISAIDNSGETNSVYVSGYVTSIKSTSLSGGKITYWIADTIEGGEQLQAYLGLGLNGAAFESIDDVEVGASVKIFGSLTKYQSTYEFEMGNYLVSYVAPTKTLTSISLSGEYPTSFEVGDTFSHEGLVVTAHYSTTATADVTSSATFSSPDMSTIGEKTVTVSYTENEVKKEAEYTINVTAVSVKYTVTYSSGEHGSGSYAHENNPAGSYKLLAFTSLEGISAEEGYKFKSYTVGGVEKNPGESIEISGATAVTVNFEEKPLEVTFDFIQMASDKGWENGEAYPENTISPITVSALGGGNNGKWYSSGGGSWRVYSGGTVEITASSGYSVESVTSSPECEFTISGGKATFAPSAKIEFTSIVVTYSQSGTITYTVEYNANGGSGTMVDSNSPYESGALVTVLENSFTREDYTFVEWNTAADGSGQSYEAGDTFNASANTVLYAQWKENGSSSTAARSYTLVEDATKLTAGAKYIIAASADNGVALSTTQNNNNRGEEKVAISGKTATVSTNKVQVISLEAGANSEQWALNVGEGYLYASSSSSNQLKTRTENSDANSEWTFVFGENGVVTITAQGSNSRKVMQYNASNGIFACYASASQSELYLYRLDFEATLLNNVTCDGAGSHTLPEGYTWGDLKAVYQDLPSSEQSALKSATAKAGSGLERYDYLVAKYSSYENFIERTITPILNERTFDSEFANNNTAIIVIVIAAASALAFTTLLVFKKKRQK